MNDRACPRCHGKSCLRNSVYGHCLCEPSVLNEGAVSGFPRPLPWGNAGGGRILLHSHCSSRTVLTGVVAITTVIVSMITAILKVMIMRVLIPRGFGVWSMTTLPSPLAGVGGVSTGGCETASGLHGRPQH